MPKINFEVLLPLWKKMYNTTSIYVTKMIFNTILGPQFKKYLWWKQHMTNLQMVQFVAIMVHGFQLVFYDDCDFPWQFAYYIGAHAVLFFGLFSEFYIRTYFKKAPEVKYQIFLAQFFFTSVTSEKERRTTTYLVILEDLGIYFVPRRYRKFFIGFFFDFSGRRRQWKFSPKWNPP